MAKRLIDLAALAEVVESIVASGRVVNAQAIAQLAGVNKSTITRNLRLINVAVPKSGDRIQGSTDEEPRSHQEIARLMREAIACEPKHRPHTDVDLISILGLRTGERNARKIRAEAGIPSAPKRRRQYLRERR